MTRRLLRLGVVMTAVVAAVLGPGQPAIAEATLQVSVTTARLVPGGSQVVLSGGSRCQPRSTASTASWPMLRSCSAIVVG